MTPSKRDPSVDPEQILSPFPVAVQRLANEVRTLVRRVAPAMSERGYAKWKGIGFRDPQAGYVFGLFPRDDHVRLFFERGGELDDSDELFEPTTTLRQGRYVVLRTAAEVKKPALKRLILRAIVHASV